MKFALALLSGLLASTVAGVAIPRPEAEAEALVERDAFAEPEAFAGPEALAEAEPEAMPAVTSALTDGSIIKIALNGWTKNANLVSTFIDNVATGKFKNQQQYLRAAKVALLAEEAEWALKEVIADYLLNNPACQSANSTLTDSGTWENVKDLLEELVGLNWTTDQAQIQQIIQEINFGDGIAGGRCNDILPAFKTYITSANALLKKLGSSPVTYTFKTPASCSASSTRSVLEG